MIITRQGINGETWYYDLGMDAWARTREGASVFNTRQEVEQVRDGRGLGRFINVEEVE